MAVTGRDLLTLFQIDMLEDAGLVMGIVTEDQFLDLLNLTITDFVKECCPYLQILTTTVGEGVSQFTLPDSMMRADDCFIGGVFLEPTTVLQLNTEMRGWRNGVDFPRRWHADQLPIKTIEVAPPPNYNGSFLRGPDFPDPPDSQIGEFSALVETAPSVFTVQQPNVHMDLTIVGPQLPATLPDLDTPIPLADDFCKAYLLMGVESRFFAGDNECRDLNRATVCQGLYEEGLSVLKAIMSEPGDEQ